MSTYSNVPVLDGIATAIHPDLNNYANGRDYYGSPVHTALERELNDHSWPWVRREYLLNEKGRETKFPHNNKKLPDAEKHDLPATFFYEVIQLSKGIRREQGDFSEECVAYYNSIMNGSSPKTMSNHARRMFFHCYAFLLGQEIAKRNITVDQLKSVFIDRSSDGGIGKKQYDNYIEKRYAYYCKNNGNFSFENADTRDRNDKKKDIEINKEPILYGPSFMMKIFALSFSYDVAKKKAIRLNLGSADTEVTKALDLEKGGVKSAATLFIFCEAAERVILEKESCSPLAKVEEIVRNTLLSGEAIMPNVQQLIGEFVEELIEAIRNKKNGSTTRYRASSLFNDIQAFISDDSVDEYGSLHIVIPNESYSLPESVIELKFSFFDINKQELSFHYIEAYSCEDEFGKPSDGYYFMPGTENDLSKSDYLSCDVKVGTVLDPNDETTAHVVAVLYQR